MTKGAVFFIIMNKNPEKDNYNIDPDTCNFLKHSLKMIYKKSSFDVSFDLAVIFYIN
jgi:hypothetical protein